MQHIRSPGPHPDPGNVYRLPPPPPDSSSLITRAWSRRRIPVNDLGENIRAAVWMGETRDGTYTLIFHIRHLQLISWCGINPCYKKCKVRTGKICVDQQRGEGGLRQTEVISVQRRDIPMREEIKRQYLALMRMCHKTFLKFSNTAKINLFKISANGMWISQHLSGLSTLRALIREAWMSASRDVPVRLKTHTKREALYFTTN